MPSSFAVGEEVGASGSDVITAAVAGYEVASRIGAAAPGRFAVRGQDSTGICGTFRSEERRVGKECRSRGSPYQETKKGEVDVRIFFFQAEDGIRDKLVTGVQTCALPI